MTAPSTAAFSLASLLLLAACGDKPAPAAGGGGAAAADPAAAVPKPGVGDFTAYQDKIGETGVTFEMVPVAAGSFTMGSPADEAGREEHEGPQHEVAVDAFWMGKFEVTWAEYDTWNTDTSRPQSKKPDGMARPTPPYMEMTFNMGRDGYPAICMSHVAARQYCKWLSEQTGHFYRLATEAEWEYACRAGSTTAYSTGDDVASLDAVAWHNGNSARIIEAGVPAEPAYHQVGKKPANAFGLHDMHGNVSEWVADFYLADAYAEANGSVPRSNPYFQPQRDRRDRPKRWSHVARGGSWRDQPATLRSAARQSSEPAWNERDPQIPTSWWYLTEGQGVGFRIVRPYREPDAEQRARFENP